MTLLTFHITEWLFIYIYCRKELSWSSTLLSIPYISAMLLATMEYGLRLYFFGKQSEYEKYWRLVGIVLVVFGEVIRKWGMLTLGSCFSHRIRTQKETHHRLVTKGTQVMLVNPISCLLFAILSWKFFQNRITFEENTLIRFYGHSYKEYQTKVWSGIPFL
ncbi:Protein-S-isoprenylcysteine O-methyltransferase B [Galdieria sulphuraria]|nr:Protein-S-isoprenylcysteine O-methyltransferase B [Galdieria sulphuraria]